MIQGIAKLFGVTRFFRTVSFKKTDALVRQVVEASVTGVCERVAEQIETMSLSEARGYVRARAARVVLRETRLLISRIPEVDARWSEGVARAATERLVPVVLRHMSVGLPRSTVLPLAMPLAA